MTRGNGNGGLSGTGPQYAPDEPFDMPFAAGEIVGGKYEILELLGVGGVAFVVAANHVELGEKVALKFLQPEMLANPEVVGRFAQEAQAAARIKSEHVARVFDVGALPDGAPFIVIEHLQGKNLDDVLREQGPLPVKRAIDYVMQACEALADAHACGIVHRDVKPENLFLTQRSQGVDVIKMLDFGVSKVALTGSAFDNRVPLVRTMLPVGSPVYMSPEQIRASKDVDVRTDIWSLGCVLYELLTGQAAFDAPSVTELAAAILEQDPRPVRSLRADIPPELEAIIVRCLQKDPHRRYQNVAELALALYPFGARRARLYAERCCMVLKVAETSYSDFELPSLADGFIQREPEPPPSTDPPTAAVRSPQPARPSWITWAVVAGGIVALVVGTWAFGRRSGPASTETSGTVLMPEPSVAASPPLHFESVPPAPAAPPPSAAPSAPVLPPPAAKPARRGAAAPVKAAPASSPAGPPPAPKRTAPADTEPDPGF